MEKINNYISDNIQFLRKQNGWTQQELAIKCGKGQTAIANYETGIREPNAVDLYRIAQIFNITVDQLVNSNIKFEIITEKEFDDDVVGILKKNILEKLSSVDNIKKKEILNELGWELMSIAKEME